MGQSKRERSLTREARRKGDATTFSPLLARAAKDRFFNQACSMLMPPGSERSLGGVSVASVEALAYRLRLEHEVGELGAQLARKRGELRKLEGS